MPNYLTPQTDLTEDIILGHPDTPFAAVHTASLQLTSKGVDEFIDNIIDKAGSCILPLRRSMTVKEGQLVFGIINDKRLLLECTQAGTTDTESIDISTVTEGQSINDGSVIWTVTTIISNNYLTKTYAKLDSPIFIGEPTAPTADIDDSSDKIATTAFVRSAVMGSSTDTSIYARLNSPAFYGIPTAPTADVEVNNDQLATTAFVHSLVNTVTSDVIRDADMSKFAPLESPRFTGEPLAPTPNITANDEQIATVEYIRTLLTEYATKSSPVLSGSPTASTPPENSNDSRIATTAFVRKLLAKYAPLEDPTFIGTVNVPTPALTADNTQAASTAFVQALIRENGGIANYKLGNNGYIKLTNNLLLQWGFEKANSIAQSSRQIVFHTPFTESCYGVWHTCTNSISWYVTGILATAFTLTTSSNAPYSGGYWIAVGV